MFSDKHRLNKEEIKQVFSRGKRIDLGKITAFILQSVEKNSYPRLAIIVSSKVSRSAVRRNKIKRMVTEVIRKEFLHFFPSNLKLILIVYFSFTQFSYGELKKYFQDIFTRLKIIK